MARKGGYSREAFVDSVKAATSTDKPVTAVAEQRARRGEGLNDLVNPAKYGLIRRALTYYQDLGDGRFIIPRGVALAVENRFDTTSSMGNNVDVAMRVLPVCYDLLLEGVNPILNRYELHMSNGAFGDMNDNFVLIRPMFETDSRVVEQMTYIVPERAGGDIPEDPHYGHFGAAYLTYRSINLYGLKGYDFTITDAPGRDYFEASVIEKVFSDQVWAKTLENGHRIDRRNLPSATDVVKDMQKGAHSFVLVVPIGNHQSTINFWTRIYGADHVVVMPRTELLPYVQAAIIGLTETTLSLQDLEEFLRTTAAGGRTGLSKADAQAVVRAVAGIPIGAQAALPNFHKLPPKHSLFASKDDIWPIEDGAAVKSEPSVWL